MEAAGWSSLPWDLVNRIADLLLATNDIDYYMGFRAVCSTWRRATEDVKNNLDPCFRPSRWIVIEEVSYSQNFQHRTRLFVNTTTGRILRKDLPMLRNYYAIYTHSGLFVLADRKPSHPACVLNPFTGHLIRFMAPMIIEKVDAAAVTGSAPTIVLFSDSCRKMDSADPDSGCFNLHRGMYAEKKLSALGTICTGDDVSKKIFDLMRSFGVHPSETLALYPFVRLGDPFETRHTDRCFLVESTGQLLMIFKLQKHMEVFKIGTENSVPERVKSIGDQAIFLGYRRCLSVNADRFQTVEANCIYYVECIICRCAIYKYDLEDEKEERISGAIRTINDVFMFDAYPPFSIIQLLSSYTFNAWDSELEMANSFERLPDVIPDAKALRAMLLPRGS